ncbi:MAG: hypothetical protein WBO23_04065 [Burkholderiales bacterium]
MAHRKAQGLADKTVNLGIALTRRILNLAARKWRDEDGRTWLDAPRKKAGMPDLHIHDLRHTVGMRLREADVREETIAAIL